MDNVTHTLCGLVIAEAALLLGAREGAPVPGYRRALCFASALANNFPDLDFLYAPITGGKLGYLLHHRGHTHTFVAALPAAIFVFLLECALSRKTRAAWARRHWLVLAATCAFGPICHIVLDYSNNYGVHPFWPFDDTWYYGDTVFIVEPWFWVTTLPPLFYLAKSRWARGVYAGLAAVALVAVWLAEPVPRVAAACIAVALVAFGLLLRVLGRPLQIVFAVGASLSVLACFVLAKAMARDEVLRAVLARFPDSKILDVALTPTPGAPPCVNALVLALERGRYVARTARVAPFPLLATANACPAAPMGVGAGLYPLAGADDANVVWNGEIELAPAEYAALVQRDCRASAFARFARAPYWTYTQSGLVLGDLRFDRNPGLDFSDLDLSASADCPKHVPPWQPPRADLERAAR